MKQQNNSRTKNTGLNYIYSTFSQIIAVLLSLVSRTVFVKTLGAGFLGINGLFTNIISVLSLAELGIGTAIIYSMYKPISENDESKIAALIGYYRKLYNYIALVVAVVGFAFFPFLDYFVNLDVEIPNVKYYYFLYLVQSVSSYLIIYRTSILTADQKNYLITKTTIFGNIATIILQVLVLVTVHSFGLYTIIPIIIGLGVNYINSRIAVKHYPYIIEKHSLEESEKKSIWVNIRSMFTYKLGGVILNNTDNLLISKIVSTTVLGLYSNYSLIIDKVSSIVNLLFTSVQASLGNYNAEKSSGQMFKMFKIISLIEYWVYGFCSVCFCLLFNDFISIWIGKEYVLSAEIVYICVVNFYIRGVLYPIWCFRNTTGLFKDTRYMMFIAAIINLVLSIVLGIRFGLVGILIATAVARICTNIWYEPRVLFRKYFKERVAKYYATELFRFIQLMIIIIGSMMLFDYVINIESIWIRLIIKILYCIFFPNIIILLENYNKEEFLGVKNRAIGLIKRMNNKL